MLFFELNFILLFFAPVTVLALILSRKKTILWVADFRCSHRPKERLPHRACCALGGGPADAMVLRNLRYDRTRYFSG